LGVAGAVVITASHNPAQYSGVKFKAAFGGSAPVSFTRGVEEEIRRIEAEAIQQAAGSRQQAAIASFDARGPWLDRLEELVDVSRIGRSGIRVALDVMYGLGKAPGGAAAKAG
jgi:phosphomannomutase